jgi:hypothetical protein
MLQAFLNKTIRENKSAAIVNMGKGVYGLKEWGRTGHSKPPSMSQDACTGAPVRSTPSTSSKATAAGMRDVHAPK